ncbi:hypothetical protein G3I40_19525 [Streptomyces sp. SID14478]|uniref:hypothetical protein n=1 Tax=Streptomyces sp. SID14478 TaxID=2706073 RepID=UPI0013DAAEBD|nr:hypothetical protein [Streptomyces sp. SID14478]NEB77390.1 hypothetical protein [Streptomyces sp. SID14478]
MRFPLFDERGPLAAHEFEALRSLNAAFLAARDEWQTACTMGDRLYRGSEAADLRTAPTAFSFYEEAIGQIADGVTAYQRRAALVAWRYTAAALVLGVAVLRRVGEAKPALTVTGVEELCQEPTLGQLKEALTIPGAGLTPERPPQAALPGEREDPARRWAMVRDGVDGVMDLVLALAAEEEAAHPRTKEEAATCLLTQHCPPHAAPTYNGVLEPLFRLAEEVPYDISRVINRG